MEIRTLVAVAALATVGGVVASANASGPTFHTPIPYTSAPDAPWDNTSPGFFLENFEDGALNTIGLGADNGSVRAPGPFTDSVDGDDGSIDGFGTAGHSWWLLETATDGVNFTFDAEELGGLPTMAGLVWTDGNPLAVVTFEAFDRNNVSLGFTQHNFGSTTHTGNTGADRFLGVEYHDGISSLLISVSTGGLEVDHVQYGEIIPVPTPGAMALLAIAGLAGNRRRRRI
ncbi:MAG: hypothetical protein HKO59_10260 [Phycisphaerales bacterium]|nr:hypothetical protein [Phycisphaerae bacterium]NNF45121.1 hypothetical protein [Phycisphaerales bacterium]NNM26347.1 hypothetical protein [Phycisphaerales bacterium]